MTLKTIEGTFVAPQGKFALVVGRFNSFVVESLVSAPSTPWFATVFAKTTSPSSALRAPSNCPWWPRRSPSVTNTQPSSPSAR